jgi:uncharacterized protein
MIISNATPLIAFARIGELALLERIVHHVTLPETVWDEVTAVTTHPGAEAIGQATWIAVHAVTSVPAELLALLDRGEAEVIALAEELKAQEVLLDERAARAIAITRGLPVIGTAGLLVRAKDRGFIPAVRPFLTRMQAEGVRYSQRFIETLFGATGRITCVMITPESSVTTAAQPHEYFDPTRLITTPTGPATPLLKICDRT